MRKIEIHKDNIKSISRGDFFKGYPIIEKKDIGNDIFLCKVDTSRVGGCLYNCG